ncbi:hypothetical protein QTP88_006578 [Uroleucon formosanum]
MTTTARANSTFTVVNNADSPPAGALTPDEFNAPSGVFEEYSCSLVAYWPPVFKPQKYRIATTSPAVAAYARQHNNTTTYDMRRTARHDNVSGEGGALPGERTCRRTRPLVLAVLHGELAGKRATDRAMRVSDLRHDDRRARALAAAAYSVCRARPCRENETPERGGARHGYNANRSRAGRERLRLGY